MTAPTLARLPETQAREVLALAVVQLRMRKAEPPRRPLLPHQIPPSERWAIWLLLGGRGSGKTEAGARATNAHADGPPCIDGPVPHRIAIIAPSHDDAVQTCVRGETGLLQVNRSIKFAPGALLRADLTWPNGSEAELFGTFAPEDVERFRGPQHCFIWWDEFAACRKLDESWDMVQFGLRLGSDPRMVLTTTPKRRPKLRDVMGMDGTVVVKARTSDNPALPEERRAVLYQRYGGTTIGRQELDAEILDDVSGALWKRTTIEALRIPASPEHGLTRVVVAIDPSATSTESADECGITVTGTDLFGHAFVLEDLSLRASPVDWAKVAISAYHRHKADRIIAETNNGGEMVEAVIRSIDPSVPYRSVTASRGKQTRAEPISALYEQGKVHHVGTFELLEDQMCQWIPGEKSPDRMDSLVWGLTELMMGAAWAGNSVSAIA